MPAKKNSKSKPDKNAPRMCLCGCGDLAKPRRSFLPGHDMKAKSMAIKVKNGDMKYSEIPAITRKALAGPGIGGMRLMAPRSKTKKGATGEAAA